ncbi:MAG: hypothetical protein U0521_07630 [Anaerolineae bacterium]
MPASPQAITAMERTPGVSTATPMPTTPPVCIRWAAMPSRSGVIPR